jgi:STE24 endopeptidase
MSSHKTTFLSFPIPLHFTNEGLVEKCKPVELSTLIGHNSLMNIIFPLFFIFQTLVDVSLDLLNRSHIKVHRNQVPLNFSDTVNLEDHQKAADLSIEKIDSSLVFFFFQSCMLLFWTLGGGLNHLFSFVQSFEYSQILEGALFILSFNIIGAFLSLPQKVYNTFILNERYGINKTTVKIFILDICKMSLLGLILLGPLLYLVLYFIAHFPNWWWLASWVSLTLFQLLLIVIYPVFIAPLFNKFSEIPEGEIKDKIEELLLKVGFSAKGVFVIDASKRSTQGNAYFTGLGKNKRIVFYDNILKQLSPTEVEAVLAHELGHQKKHHIVKGMAKSILMSFVMFALLKFLLSYDLFYSLHGITTHNMAIGLVLVSLIGHFYTGMFTPLGTWQSRKFEFEADGFAKQFSSGENLARALKKMYKFNFSSLTPHPLYSSFYYSHPPPIERVIKLLEE